MPVAAVETITCDTADHIATVTQISTTMPPLDLSARAISAWPAPMPISLRETKIAIVADLGSLQRLPPIIGQGHTRELARSWRRGGF